MNMGEWDPATWCWEDIGEYANPIIKGLEKDRLVYQFLVEFFIPHIEFLEFSSAISFVEVEKTVLLAAE